MLLFEHVCLQAAPSTALFRNVFSIFIVTYGHAVPFDEVILPIREPLSQFTSEDLSSFEEQNKSRKIKKKTQKQSSAPRKKEKKEIQGKEKKENKK